MCAYSRDADSICITRSRKLSNASAFPCKQRVEHVRAKRWDALDIYLLMNSAEWRFFQAMLRRSKIHFLRTNNVPYT